MPDYQNLKNSEPRKIGNFYDKAIVNEIILEKGPNKKEEQIITTMCRLSDTQLGVGKEV